MVGQRAVSLLSWKLCQAEPLKIVFLVMACIVCLLFCGVLFLFLFFVYLASVGIPAKGQERR